VRDVRALAIEAAAPVKAPPMRCEVSGCGGFTRERKPVCGAHLLEHMPYAAQVAAGEKAGTRRTWGKCRDCGARFGFVVSESAGPKPCRCESCKAAKRERAAQRRAAS
jgi:hypothetical protein